MLTNVCPSVVFTYPDLLRGRRGTKLEANTFVQAVALEIPRRIFPSTTSANALHTFLRGITISCTTHSLDMSTASSLPLINNTSFLADVPESPYMCGR